MNKCIHIFAAFLLIVFSECKGNQRSHLTFEKMMVEYAENPINIDNQHPRFSWVISSPERNQRQSAYRIIVSDFRNSLFKNIGDFWDSGKINSSETIQHELKRVGLMSNRKYFWKVIIWDGNGNKFESPVSSFETAFLNPGDWEASWIGKGPQEESLPKKGFIASRKEQAGMKDTVVHYGQSLLLREERLLSKNIKSARAFVTGLGFYEFYINGQRVGDHVLAPAKSPYHKHILYDTYDVTGLVHKGENAFGFHLGNGWYNPYKKWWAQYRMQWFGHKKAIAQIEITYTDSSKEIIKTDQSWRYSGGPITFSCIYDGEVYDARLEQAGWTSVGFDDSRWKPVTVFHNVKARLSSETMPPVRVIQTIQPHEVKVDKPNMRVFDMGQNFAGWARIKVEGNKGTRIKVRFAEDIHDDGTIDITSNEHAKARAEYILKGLGVESYEPRFTYFGFKYVEVTAENGPLDLKDIEGCVVHSDNKLVGSFECSNQLVNKLHHATVWSQKSNMIGYPMDCPQRDERLGWFGDAQVTAEEAMFNFNMPLFYQNWFAGIKDNQDEKTGDIPIISPQPYIWDEGVEWSSTYIMMLWNYYRYYDDKQILAEHYDAMKHYMGFLDSIATDFIVPMGWIGDWGSMTEGWKEGNPRSIPTAFYFFDTKTLAKIASVIGKNDDAEYFDELAAKIAKAYNKEYLDEKTGNYLTGTQMDNAFPLFLGLVPDRLEQKVLENLVNDIVVKHSNHLTTGVLGTKYMPEALAKFGHCDVAWNIINQKTYPSWNSMMEKYTTVCEFWTLKQSKNHVMMGSIDAWFYKYIAGIQLDENNPAYAKFTIKPALLNGLTYAEGKTETVRGTVLSNWKKEDGKFSLDVKVPFNTSAMIYIPGKEKGILYESKKPLSEVKSVEYLKYEDGAHVLKVSSGTYAFTLLEN